MSQRSADSESRIIQLEQQLVAAEKTSEQKEAAFVSQHLQNAACISSASKEIAEAKLKMAQLEQELGVLRDALAQSQAVAAAARASCEEKDAVLEVRRNEMKGLLCSQKDADDRVAAATIALRQAEAAKAVAETAQATAEAHAAAASAAQEVAEGQRNAHKAAAAKKQTQLEATIEKLTAQLGDASKWAMHKSQADAKISVLQTQLEAKDDTIAQLHIQIRQLQAELGAAADRLAVLQRKLAELQHDEADPLLPPRR